MKSALARKSCGKPRVGTLTSIGRDLYPAILDHFAKHQPGWQVELRSSGWGDATGGLRDRAADAAFVWLPVDDPGLDSTVLATERRFVARLRPGLPRRGRRGLTVLQEVRAGARRAAGPSAP